MIRCKDDILQRLKDNGYSSYKIVKQNLISKDQMQKIRHGEQISIYALNSICELLQCQPGDVIDYVPDTE